MAPDKQRLSIPTESGPELPPAESWLIRFRPWLTLLARTQVDHGYQGKFDASDLVQQTLIEAWKSAEQFRGKTEAERMAWLRQILAHVLAHEVRRYFGTLKRDADREISFEASLEQSSRRWQGLCDSAMTSPSQHVLPHGWGRGRGRSGPWGWSWLNPLRAHDRDAHGLEQVHPRLHRVAGGKLKADAELQGQGERGVLARLEFSAGIEGEEGAHEPGARLHGSPQDPFPRDPERR